MSSWLAEDPELLRATLAIIDTWGENGGARVSSPSRGDETTGSEHDDAMDLEHGDSVEDSPHVSSNKPSRASRSVDRVGLAKRSTNQRRRHEIQELQEQIRAMETQLIALQVGRQTLYGAAGPHQTSLWQDVAQNQLRLRRQSEMERAKLKRLLEAHTSIAQDMARLIHKAQAMQEDEVVRSLKLDMTSTRLDLYPQTGDQFDRVNLLYSHQDAVFGHLSFHNGPASFVDVDLVHDLDRELVLEFREAWTVPFEAPAVLRALWTFTKKRYEVKWRSPGQQILLDTDDSFASQFAVRAVIDSYLFSSTGQLLLRCFTGSNTDQTPAIVTTMSSAPNASECDGHTRLWMQENSSLRAIPWADSNPTAPITLVQCSHHVSVRFDGDDDETSRGLASKLTHFVLAKLKADTQVKQNTVQNVLLQSARAIC